MSSECGCADVGVFRWCLQMFWINLLSSMITGCRDRKYQWEGSSPTLHKQFRRQPCWNCTQSQHQRQPFTRKEPSQPGRNPKTQEEFKNVWTSEVAQGGRRVSFSFVIRLSVPKFCTAWSVKRQSNVPRASGNRVRRRYILKVGLAPAPILRHPFLLDEGCRGASKARLQRSARGRKVPFLHLCIAGEALTSSFTHTYHIWPLYLNRNWTSAIEYWDVRFLYCRQVPILPLR